MAKQYGLVVPKKAQLSAPKAGNVFGNDDDSEEEGGTDWVKKALKAENEKNKIKKSTKLTMQKALAEDDSIYKYDEVYDDIKKSEEREKTVKKEAKKPKYICNLLKSAELRKKEQDLRKDRLIQKEIEAENEMFGDKERFVTSSYKKKLEEMKEFEKEQENMDRLEAIGDVTKQKDISGFYRHLYRQTVENNAADLGITPEKKTETEELKSNVVKEELNSDIDKDSAASSSESEESDKSEKNEEKKSKDSESPKIKIKRQYRQRAQEVSESESEDEPVKVKRKAEKRKLVDKATSKEVEPVKEKRKAVDKEISKEVESKDISEPLNKKEKLIDETLEESNKSSTKENIKLNNENTEKADENSQNKKDDKEKVEKKEKPKPVEKKKINIWQKRTVGVAFEAALERYLLRKEARLSGSA